jgi:hypothetical protein
MELGQRHLSPSEMYLDISIIHDKKILEKYTSWTYPLS